MPDFLQGLLKKEFNGTFKIIERFSLLFKANEEEGYVEQ